MLSTLQTIRVVRLTVAPLCVASIAAVGPAAAQDAVRPEVPSIVTSGEASVRRAPDRVFITAAVESRARNPRDAQRLNADVMTKVQQALRAAGLEGDTVRTLGYSIQQEVDYANGRRVLRDYLAWNGVEVRLDAVDRTGDILDVVVQAGATSVTGIRFDLQDRASVERDALRLAVIDARARAEAAAAGAGRAVGDVLRIDDTRQGGPAPRPMFAMARGAADAQEATPIEPGEIEIRATVTLTVAIR